MKCRRSCVLSILLASVFLLRPDTSVTADDPEQPADPVGREVRVVRSHIETISANKRLLEEELRGLRGKLKESRSRLEELQAKGKDPVEIDVARLDVKNARAKVNRKESLLDSAHKMIAEYEGQIAPDDIVSVVLSRSMLRRTRDEIRGVCDSDRDDLEKMKDEYERLSKKGDPGARPLGDEIEMRLQRFKALIRTYEDVQALLDKAQPPDR
jgi:chromosome segregation ATPase